MNILKVLWRAKKALLLLLLLQPSVRFNSFFISFWRGFNFLFRATAFLKTFRSRKKIDLVCRRFIKILRNSLRSI